MFKKKSEDRPTLDELDSGGIYWKEVLHYLYQYTPIQISSGQIGWTEEHPLAKKLKISGLDLNMAVDFLKMNGLVEPYISDKQDTLRLSKKGFEVALQNERIKNEEKSQRVLKFLTFVLALSTAFTFLSSLDILYNNMYRQNLLAGGFCITLIVVFYYVYHYPKKD